ncbi:MAG: hypothetical protein ACXABN_19050 [Candidatus Thorarchaeota archaeon]
MPPKSKKGKQKRYGPKMAAPRISKSKERRSCGPLGRQQRYRLWMSNPEKFKKPTVMPWRRKW